MAETVSCARFKLLFHVLLDAPPVLRPWSSSPALRDAPQVAHHAERYIAYSCSTETLLFRIKKRLSLGLLTAPALLNECEPVSLRGL